jgi:hypothetical protein
MSKSNFRKRVALSLVTLLFAAVLFGGTVTVFAAGNGSLDGIGVTPTTAPVVQATTPPVTQATAPPVGTQQGGTTQVVDPKKSDTGNGGATIGSIFDNIGVDAEAAKKASQYVGPASKFVNLCFAIILSIASLGLFLITALDLLYIAVPPLRNLLYPGGQEQGGSGGGMGMGGMGMGGMGMGGMRGGYGGGMGMGGMGMGGGGQQQPQGNMISRWISDEAVAAVAHLQPQQSGGGMGMGMGMGGMGMGGMGGGAQAPAPMKSVLVEYLKKRAFFLIMFGVCAVLLSTTIFSDLGIKLGGWILNRLFGFETNFPA